MRWAYLILGGALLVPYLIFAAILAPAVIPLEMAMAPGTVIVLLLMLAALLASSLIPAVRVLEGAAVREMLGDPVPGASFGTGAGRSVRLRCSAMYALHVLGGGVISVLTLVLPVLFVFTVPGPFTGVIHLGERSVQVPSGWAGVWLPGVFLVATLAMFPIVSLTGAALTKAAKALLGLPPAERIAQLERRTEQLAERNRLARELHDSVGHALSVVTLQAGAARRTVRTDPAVAERSLGAIEDSARAALNDLDHVLGLLREDRAGTEPQAGLGELSALFASTRAAGVEVRVETSGDFDEVPPVVSREAYRIMQECLTNAVRHGGRVPVAVLVDADRGELRMSVTNPVGAPGRSGGGRGVRGMAERAELLRGELTAGLTGEVWTVAVRLPWGV